MTQRLTSSETEQATQHSLVPNISVFAWIVAAVSCGWLGLILMHVPALAAPAPALRDKQPDRGKPPSATSAGKRARPGQNASGKTPSSLPTAKPAPWAKGLSLKQLKQLHKKLQKAQKKHKMVGFGYAIVTPTKIWARGVGYADREAKRKAGPNTVYRIGSISKSFVAMGFLKLAEQDKIKLNAPIKPWVKGIDITNPWAAKAPIQIAHLLEHTAGFDDMHFNELYDKTGTAQRSLARALAVNPSSRWVRWRPGTWSSYSNPGYSLAGYVMEQITKRPFDEYLREQILEPLGMKTASFRKTKALAARLAKGYSGAPAKEVPYLPIYHRPAGSMLASPHELAKFVQCLLNRGKVAGKPLLSEASIQRMEFPKTALHAKKGLAPGYGLGNYVSVKDGIATHGHDGGIDGFIASARYSLSHQMGYVLLFNHTGSFQGIKAVRKLLRETIKSSRKPLKLPKAVRVDTKALAQQAGMYQVIHSRNQLFSFLQAISWVRISLRDGKLQRSEFAVLTWQSPKTLVPLGKGQFRLADQPTPSHLFAEHNGEKLLFIGSQALRRRASWRPWLYGYSLAFAMLMMVLSLLFSLIWLPRRFLMKREMPYLRARVLPTLAGLSLFAAVIALQSSAGYAALGVANLHTVGFCVLTGLFGLLACASVVTAALHWRQPKASLAARIFCTLASVSVFGLMIFLWPVIGVRLWVY